MSAVRDIGFLYNSLQFTGDRDQLRRDGIKLFQSDIGKKNYLALDILNVMRSWMAKHHPEVDLKKTRVRGSFSVYVDAPQSPFGDQVQTYAMQASRNLIQYTDIISVKDWTRVEQSLEGKLGGLSGLITGGIYRWYDLTVVSQGEEFQIDPIRSAVQFTPFTLPDSTNFLVPLSTDQSSAYFAYAHGLALNLHMPTSVAYSDQSQAAQILAKVSEALGYLMAELHVKEVAGEDHVGQLVSAAQNAVSEGKEMYSPRGLARRIEKVYHRHGLLTGEHFTWDGLGQVIEDYKKNPVQWITFLDRG